MILPKNNFKNFYGLLFLDYDHKRLPTPPDSITFTVFIIYCNRLQYVQYHLHQNKFRIVLQ